MGRYSYSGSAQKVPVQATGTFKIVGYGAQGGAGAGTSAGGKGAEVGGSFNLQHGEVLELFVGQQGGSIRTSNGCGGGGGGTFVLADVNAQGTLTPGHYTLLLAAGGGGGAGSGNGGNATVTPSGNGLGGAGGGNYGAGGGAGFKGSGGRGYHGGNYYFGSGGYAVTSSINPGGGGSYYSGNYRPVSAGRGGFGGGGAGGGFHNGGGGGGYTGGAGGAKGVAGSGGSAYFSKLGTADATRMVAGQHTGDGLVTITPSVACFVTGTRIAVARGRELVDVAVEDLVVGDRVVTASGALRPIHWLGRRTLDCRRHPSPRDAQPIRVAAQAFGASRPARDLLLSPGHSVCVDVLGEVLIPAGRLVNGATVTQLDVDAVTYWHVELDAHEIILAENLPCESYIDCGNRAFFAESGRGEPAAAPDGSVHTADDDRRPVHAAADLRRSSGNAEVEREIFQVCETVPRHAVIGL